MAVTKRKNNYIDMDLKWLENKAKEMKKFVDDNPLDKLKDRILEVGNKVLISSTIETQHKNIRDTLKDYALLIEAIAKLREQDEDRKQQVRGDQNLTPLEAGDI